MADIQNETLALAAQFQAVSQIVRIARFGSCDEVAAATIIRGIIITNPNTCFDIYEPGKLLSGYRQLISSFGGEGASAAQGDNFEISKLTFQIISLADAIRKNSAIFDKLGNDIDSLRDFVLSRNENYENANASEILNEDIIARMAELYQSLISPNFPKLVIFGEQQYLSNLKNQQLIRALLLGCIRAVVLWQQLGCKKLTLFLRRKSIINCARQCVQSINY